MASERTGGPGWAVLCVGQVHSWPWSWSQSFFPVATNGVWHWPEEEQAESPAWGCVLRKYSGTHFVIQPIGTQKSVGFGRGWEQTTPSLCFWDFSLPTTCLIKMSSLALSHNTSTETCSSEVLKSFLMKGIVFDSSDELLRTNCLCQQCFPQLEEIMAFVILKECVFRLFALFLFRLQNTVICWFWSCLKEWG